jgi:hypothetical protein
MPNGNEIRVEALGISLELYPILLPTCLVKSYDLNVGIPKFIPVVKYNGSIYGTTLTSFIIGEISK